MPPPPPNAFNPFAVDAIIDAALIAPLAPIKTAPGIPAAPFASSAETPLIVSRVTSVNPIIP